MKKIIIQFLFILTALFFCSCEKNDLSTSNTFALIGFISKKNGIQVTISKAFDSNDKTNNIYNVDDIDYVFQVKNAIVRVVDKQGVEKQLNFISKGRYVLDSLDFKPISEGLYKIIADIPTYGKIESDWVVFPREPILEKFNYRIDSTFIGEQKFYQADLSINIRDSNRYFLFHYDAFNETGLSLYNLYTLTKNNVKLNEKKGVECGRFYHINNIFFTNDCLDQGVYYEYLRLDGSNPNLINTSNAKNITFSLNAISDSYYKYTKSIILQEEIDVRFQEMPPSYTNIKNGIGIFYAVNEGDKTFTIKP